MHNCRKDSPYLPSIFVYYWLLAFLKFWKRTQNFVKKQILPQDPGGSFCCGPPWRKRTWNVSITYCCDAEFQSTAVFFFSISCSTYICSSCGVEVTLALLDAATDKDSKVQEQVRKSILTLGKQQPDRVVAMCQDYLLQHPKVKKSPDYYLACFSLPTQL